MEVFKCVSTLSSIRGYQNKDVDAEIIHNVIEAGRLTPSARNDQPWEFILIVEKKKLERMVKYCISGNFISQAAFAVVVLSDPRSKWHEIDTTRAVQNMVLTAWSFGLGSCWIGRIDDVGLKQFLQIPDRWNVLTVLPFGYFNKDKVTTRKYRKNPEDVFHLNSYGNNYKGESEF